MWGVSRQLLKMFFEFVIVQVNFQYFQQYKPFLSTQPSHGWPLNTMCTQMAEISGTHICRFKMCAVSNEHTIEIFLALPTSKNFHLSGHIDGRNSPGYILPVFSFANRSTLGCPKMKFFWFNFVQLNYWWGVVSRAHKKNFSVIDP